MFIFVIQTVLFFCVWHQLRKLISDFSIFMSIMTFVGLDMLIGLKTPKLIVPTEFKVISKLFIYRRKQVKNNFQNEQLYDMLLYWGLVGNFEWKHEHFG